MFKTNCIKTYQKTVYHKLERKVLTAASIEDSIGDDLMEPGQNWPLADNGSAE